MISRCPQNPGEVSSCSGHPYKSGGCLVYAECYRNLPRFVLREHCPCCLPCPPKPSLFRPGWHTLSPGWCCYRGMCQGLSSDLCPWKARNKIIAQRWEGSEFPCGTSMFLSSFERRGVVFKAIVSLTGSGCSLFSFCVWNHDGTLWLCPSFLSELWKVVWKITVSIQPFLLIYL